MLQNDFHKDFYFQYFRIGQHAHREKVKFFEDHKSRLSELEIDQQYDVKIDYLLSLFEVGRYEYFLGRVDEMIETVIMENIYTYNGENIYHNLLFKKSASLYNLGRYDKSQCILKALIKMDADHKVARILYSRCRRKSITTRQENVRAIAMVSLLSALSIFVAETFVVEPFYSEWAASLGSLRKVLMILGISIWVGSELYFKYNIGKNIGFRFSFRDYLKAANNWLIKQGDRKY